MVEYWKSRNGRWYFHRKARNGRITDPSQGYANVSNCRRAIRSRWGVDARMVRIAAP